MEANDYCSYELSLALKKAGCNFYTDAVYLHRDRSLNDFSIALVSRWGNEEYHHAVPLWQAQKWLREKYGLLISVNPYVDSSNDADGRKCDEWQYWASDIMPVKTARTIAEVDEMYDSYEQALSAGIEAALQFLDNKNK